MRINHSVSPILSNIEWLNHAFFTRNGGVSDGIFASLNVGYSSGDDYDRIDENRKIICRTLNLKDGLLVNCNQVHSNTVAVVTRQWGDDLPNADGMVTSQPQLGLSVFTADCAPILMADRSERIVGAAHVGWQGAFSGICESTVDAMVSLGASSSRLVAAIGPCIQQASYEVGEDFYVKFLDRDLETIKLFQRCAMSNKIYFDLPAYIRNRLVNAGVREIDASQEDTYTSPRKFFSARRSSHLAERGYGRMFSVIYIR